MKTAGKKNGGPGQIFPFDILWDQSVSFATITSLLTADNSLRLAQNAIFLRSPFSRKKTRALMEQATSFHQLK